ncbi:FAD/NAD(P)-binding protein [Amycolatopsis sp. lyj-23]|uniref:FAD/NAD(P)-binding protein n=1 Tax=Amycolatopsis sp. lyj-23 TaxID=2789283 RepID=UPI00397D8573
MSGETSEIAVVGLGPRGLSVAERLCANAAELGPPGRRLLVHLVDPHLAEGGRVWRSTQDRLLLMNTVACQVTMFADESVGCAGPVVPGPSLYEWARSIALLGSPDVPAAVRAEAAALGPDDYPSRAFYGSYLRWTRRRIARLAPPSLRFEVHPARAVDVRDTAGRQEVVLDDGGVLGGLDVVVLALGHLPHELGPAEARLSRYAREHGLRYLPPGNPADAPPCEAAAGEPVLLRGMGLNFFDHLALLTLGRGGAFTRTPAGRLAYRASGREPRLIAGSRRGVPYHARARNEKGAFGRHEPRYLTPAVIDRLRGGADFRRDVWPLIDQEVRTVFYAAQVREQGCACDAGEFAAAFAAAGPADVSADPPAVRETEAQRTVLAGFGLAPDWDWRAVANPYSAADLVSTTAFRRRLRALVAADLTEAAKGNVTGPLKAATDVLRDLRNEIRLVVDHGGISGRSYRDELQGWYVSLNAFLSIGPPAERVEQFGALLDAGVLEVLGPDLRVTGSGGRFRAWSAACPDVTAEATTLIEARLPETDLRRTADPLLRAMLARGACRPYRIGEHVTGGLAVTRRPYHVLDARNRPHPRRFAFGVPTEGVHWVTAAGIRPGVDSVILGDADAIARSCLEAVAGAGSRRAA